MTARATSVAHGPERKTKRPRLGMLGLGWIGRLRLQALAMTGEAGVVALCEPLAPNVEAARQILGDSPCAVADSLEGLLDHGVDGVVISTPSALHREQAARVLEAGVPVFCQKPLARTEAENRTLIDAARRADLLLGVDLSYRHVRGVEEMRRLIGSGELGRVYAAELVFHNAYGPDKAWYRDPALSGGGCVIDLGIHLIDLLLWAMNGAEVDEVAARLYRGGEPVATHAAEAPIEDYADVRLDLSGGATARVACSWNLAAGRDAVIRATFYGTEGGVELRNIGGSFFDLQTVRFVGTREEEIEPCDRRWGGRALDAWVRRLARSSRFDPEIERMAQVARTIDRVYGRGLNEK